MTQQPSGRDPIGTQPQREVVSPRGADTGARGPVQPAAQAQPVGPSIQEVVARQIRTPETKEFSKTSEFLVWGLGVAALLIASGMIDDSLDAPLTWRLISLLSIAYILSRGLAKAAARRGERDIDRDYGVSGGYGGQASAGDRASDFAQRHIATRETKEFFKTSEFLVWLLTTAGIFIASGAVDVYDAGEAWTHATWVTMAYVISRGISKLGTRQDAPTT